MHLRETLTDVLAQRPAAAHVKCAVLELQLIAIACLRLKSRSGRGHMNATGLSIDDIALDCIAPLFERNSRGEFHRLQTYFTGVSWQTLTDEELLSYTRRLVFSSVNQGLAKIWKQLDPSLEKLLRNLTAAIRASSSLEIVPRMVHNQVVLKPSNPSDRGEEMSQEYLEAMLSLYIREGISMKGVVNAVTAILAEQEIYRRDIPLVRLGIAIRVVFARSTLPLTEAEPGMENQLLPQEIASSIQSSVCRIRQRMEMTYVGRGKTDIATYSSYFEVISQYLHARYVDRDGEGLSLFSCLAGLTPRLTIETYRTDHRAVLEYLFQLSESEFLGTIQREL